MAISPANICPATSVVMGMPSIPKAAFPKHSATGIADSGFLKPPGGTLCLDGGIHVWRFSDESLDGSVLGVDEVIRAEKYRSEEARAAFVAGRSGLRRAASLYSNIPPRELAIETDAEGKPFFANAGIHFNLSHSGGVVVAAFSGSPVGIDVESRGRPRDFAGIAGRFFHPDEAGAIEDEEGFLQLWTRKEAMLKLSGEGISGGLSEARPGADGTGTIQGKRVHLAAFAFENVVGAVAAFEPFEVKGWFQF